jgi:hypothetical protein
LVCITASLLGSRRLTTVLLGDHAVTEPETLFAVVYVEGSVQSDLRVVLGRLIRQFEPAVETGIRQPGIAELGCPT